MPSYNNGYIPESLLITFNVGVSAGEGLWKHQLSAGTYAKHLALVDLARKNTGRTLAISSGWGAYRPMPAQVYARKVHGNGAATPGTSSHGGFWEGQQTLAIDYGNWSYVYNGDRAAFYRDARAVGLEPGLIVPARGYPDEPWHVVDKQPWNAPAGGGGSEIIMDKETFIAWMWEFFKYRSRDGGGSDWKGGLTIFERLTGLVGSVATLTGLVNPDEPEGGKGWFPFRNALSRWLIYHSRVDGPEGKGATIHERLNQIEAAVREAPGDTVTVKIDAAMLASALSDPKVIAAFAGPIAKAVNDDHYRRMEK